jgi:SAM-dependent methyltransferase
LSDYFDKYKKWGAYHFKWYGHGGSRHERYVRHVDKVKSWIQEKNVLDVGAGEGLMCSVIGMKGIEINPIAVRLAQQRNVDVILGDVYDLPCEDEEFDSVFMGDVMEHLEFPDRALAEIRRVLKKYLYLVIPRKETWFDPLGQYHDWTPEEMKAEVEVAGFVLEGEIEEANRKMYGRFKKV